MGHSGTVMEALVIERLGADSANSGTAAVLAYLARVLAPVPSRIKNPPGASLHLGTESLAPHTFWIDG